MKDVEVYDLSEIKKLLLQHIAMEYELYIPDALFEWSRYDRFVHLNVDKLEYILEEYRHDGLKVSMNKSKIPDKVQKWIDITNELLILIENKELQEEFIVDYYSDLDKYK